MSDTENRKSMDDVLASIRKIVRAEKDPEGVQDAQTSPMESVAAPSVNEAVEEASPLALTPDMMMEGEALDVEAVQDAMSDVPDATEAVESIQENVSEISAIDPEMIRGMVRDVVMEQLSRGDAEGLIRGIIRDELTTGDVGSNISTNVLKLIQSEIGKAMGN